MIQRGSTCLVRLGRRLYADVARQTEPADSAPATLVDLHGRRHNYLRISLTERCNLRCQYCMPAEGVPLSARSALLTRDEIIRFVRMFADLGVDKVRLTGGEPTLRKDLPDIIRGLMEIEGISKVSMTTNGLVLTRQLPALQRAGLGAINVSLDSLQPERYQAMSRRTGLSRVLAGIDLALQLGYRPVKINTVLMKGFNDDEICDFVEFTRDREVEIRFIEFMPFSGNKWEDSKLVPYRKALRIVTDTYPELMPCLPRPNDTARVWQVPGYAGTVGFISSMTQHFCSSCNRLRLTADGNLKVCLFGSSEVSLRDAARGGASDAKLAGLVRDALNNKKKQHAARGAGAASVPGAPGMAAGALLAARGAGAASVPGAPGMAAGALLAARGAGAASVPGAPGMAAGALLAARGAGAASVPGAPGMAAGALLAARGAGAASVPGAPGMAAGALLAARGAGAASVPGAPGMAAGALLAARGAGAASVPGAPGMAAGALLAARGAGAASVPGAPGMAAGALLAARGAGAASVPGAPGMAAGALLAARGAGAASVPGAPGMAARGCCSGPALSHVDAQGRARMVDVADKRATRREAEARCELRVGGALLRVLRDARLAKGDALTVAQVAGTLAAKRTADLIPLCHPLPLDCVRVHLQLPPETDGDGEEGGGVQVRCEVSVKARTGAEMEALTGAALAALTLYDMCKAVDKHMTITNLRVVRKSGGKSDFPPPPPPPSPEPEQPAVRPHDTSPVSPKETYAPSNFMYF